MLPGLTKEEFNQLLLSVGRTPKQRRPLSPVEVGQLCNKAETSGASRSEITLSLQMTDTGMVSKFLKLSKLDPSLQHLIEWGHSGGGAIGFSVAAQLVRFDALLQPGLAELILKHKLSKSEMISVHQLLDRSGAPLGDCVVRVVKRRPGTEELHIITGAVSETGLQAALNSRTQEQRDRHFDRALHDLLPALGRCVAKLGPSRFTVIGGVAIAKAFTEDRTLEARIAQHLKGQLESGESDAG